MTDTEEQVAIYNEAEYGYGNMVIRARAGAGKTHTLINIAKRLPQSKSITFVAFNKHIQEELKRKLPSNIFVYTSHGLGYSAIKRKYKDCEIDEFKVDKVIAKHIKSWDMSQVANIIEYVGKIKQMVNLIRLTLTFDPNRVLELAEKYDFKFDFEDTKRCFHILEEMLNNKKTIDFTDMVYLPCVDKKIWLFPQDFVLVDECFPYEQNIITKSGKIKIGILEKKYREGEKLPMLLTYNEKTKLFEYDNIQKVWCNGQKDVFEVILGRKRKIKSTLNHKYLTNNGWKELINLKIGDFLIGNGLTQPYTTLPTKIQKDIIYGSLLGDGYLNEISNNCYRLSVIHGEKQKKYLKWKKSFFDSKYELIKENVYSKKKAYRFTTKSIYLDKNEIKLKYIIDNINIRILSIMVMDDGSYDGKNTFRLYSTAKSLELTKKLSKKINELLLVESVVRKGKSTTTNIDYFWVEFNTSNYKILSNKLKEYIHPNLEYKLCEEDRGFFNLNYWIDDENKIYGMVVTSEHKFIKKCNVYDIEMKKNHNFLVSSSSTNLRRKFDYGLVAHNCQDLSKAQHELVKKLVKWDKATSKPTTRCIYVGDDLQSIYGFTGADTNSFENLTRFPNTKVLPLTTTFRCGKNIVLEANKIVTDIKPMESAEDGIVRIGNALDEAGDGDFILARKTLPLVRMFFNFLILKKKATIKGSDFGINLIHMIEGEKSLAQLGATLANNLTKLSEKLQKSGVFNVDEHTGYVMLKDKTDVITFLMKTVNSVDELKQMIMGIFKDNITDGIMLSTVHKAKGLEADRVFIIKPKDMPLKVSKGWMYQQEMNLKYIAITRAKKELIYDNDWSEEDDFQTDLINSTYN